MLSSLDWNFLTLDLTAFPLSFDEIVLRLYLGTEWLQRNQQIWLRAYSFVGRHRMVFLKLVRHSIRSQCYHPVHREKWKVWYLDELKRKRILIWSGKQLRSITFIRIKKNLFENELNLLSKTLCHVFYFQQVCVHFHFKSQLLFFSIWIQFMEMNGWVHISSILYFQFSFFIVKYFSENFDSVYYCLSVPPSIFKTFSLVAHLKYQIAATTL